MRTHFLRDLLIKGSEGVLRLLPEFDFHDLRQVRRIAFEAISDEARAPRSIDIVLTAMYEDSQTNRSFEVTLKFGGTRYARLPEFTPLFFLSEVEIEDVSKDQMEGVNYRIKDYGMTEFEVLCHSLEILQCQAR